MRLLHDLLPRIQRMAIRVARRQPRLNRDSEDIQQDAIVGLLKELDQCMGLTDEHFIRGRLVIAAKREIICGILERRMFCRSTTPKKYSSRVPGTTSLFREIRQYETRGRAVSLIDTFASRTKTPVEILEAIESDHRILSDAQFAVLALFYEQGLTEERIAIATGLQVVTVKLLRTTGCDALRTKMPSPDFVHAIRVPAVPIIVAEKIAAAQAVEIGQRAPRQRGLIHKEKGVQDKQARYRQRLRAEGKCERCGKPAAPYTLCDEHRAKQRRKRKKGGVRGTSSPLRHFGF